MATISDRTKLSLPGGAQKLLLHSCCAPCAGEIMETLQYSDIAFTLYFYNPNIHPYKEYLLRKEENKSYAWKLNIPFIDADYDKEDWYARVKGLEKEPERGMRCTLCFDMRFERTALYAFEQGYRIFSSTLAISRWKNRLQINGSGKRAAARYDKMQYWDYNWRQDGGAKRMLEISKREHFYQQQYCGCSYSLRDINAHRKRQGRPPVTDFGATFY